VLFLSNSFGRNQLLREIVRGDGTVRCANNFFHNRPLRSPLTLAVPINGKRTHTDQGCEVFVADLIFLEIFIELHASKISIMDRIVKMELSTLPVPGIIHCGYNRRVENFKNNLKLIRERAGLTQGQLAHRIGTSTGQINKLEDGSRRMSDVWLAKLCPALGVSVGEILGGELQPVRHPIRMIPVLGVVPGGPMIEAIADDHPETIPFPTDRDDLFALRVEGTSMNKIAAPGSFVVVDPRQTDPLLLDNKPVIVQSVDQVTFKKWDNGNKLLLPDSTENHEIIRPYYDMIFKGRVIAVLNLLGD
jgi:repressor LexA